MGDFSCRLHSLKKGESIMLTRPDGFFYLQENHNIPVFIAGGIGITPFYSIIRSITETKTCKRKMYLFYSNKRKSDIAFYNTFQAIEKQYEHLKVLHVLTQAQGEGSQFMEQNRIDSDLLKEYLSDINKNHDFYICGPTDFVQSMWHMLRGEVGEDNIYTEAYYI